MYKEGDIADGPNGPLVYSNGKWRPLSASPQAVTLGRPNPAKQKADDLSNIIKQLEIDAKKQEMADKNKPNLPTGYQWSKDGTRAELIPGVAAPGNNAKGDPGKLGAYDAVIKQIDRLYELYNQGIGKTSGVAGVLDYLPTDANAAFNTAGAALGDQGNAAFKVPGMGAQSDADAARFVAANQPQASDRDVAALEKLRALRQRIESNMGAQGLPLPKWNYDLQGKPVAAAQKKQELPGAVVGPDGVQRSNRVFANPNGGQGGIATGATAQGEAPPPQFQQAMSAWVEANRGKMTPESYVNAFNMMAQTFNYPGRANEVNAVKEVEQLNKGVPYSGVAPGVKQTSAIDQAKGAFFTNPAGAALTNYANANMLGIPGAFSGGAIDAIRAESPKASFVGDLAGSLTGIAGLTKGALKTGLAKDLPQALLRTNLAYGTVKGASEMPENPFLGAAVGLSTSAAGEGAGRLLVAPAVKAIAQSRGGQEVGNAARRMAPGIFGRRQMPVTSPLSTRDQMIVSAVGDNGPQAMGNLREASRLGLPFTLADANPNLRALAGSAVRKSPVVRQLAEDTLRPRATGQIDRLQSAISRDFGNPANILETSDALIKKASEAAAPLYREAYAAPAVGSPEIDSLLQTPFARDALGRARTIAANERRDPTAMGFSLDADGNVVLNPVQTDLYGAQAAAKAEFDAANAAHQAAMIMPGANTAAASARLEAARKALESANAALQNAPTAGVAQGASNYTPQTLDYVKRGMDDVLEQYRNPMTGKLQLDEAGRAQNGVLRSLLSEVDRINPAYGRARAAYAGPAGERSALQMGTQVPNQSAEEVAYALGNLGGNKPDQYRLGAVSALSQQANKVRYTGNPYDAIAGSPEARARLGVLWPQTAPRFTRQADLEAEMGRTFTEALGGSQTQARNMADQAFDASPVMTLGIDAANAVATGSPPVATMARLGGNFFKDSYRLGLGQAKANEIGPVLLNPDAAQAAAIFADIRKNAMKAKMLGSKTSKQAKTVGDITASAIAAPLTSYLLGQ